MYIGVCIKGISVMRNKTMAEALGSSGDGTGAGVVPAEDGVSAHCRVQRMRAGELRKERPEMRLGRKAGPSRPQPGL